MIKIGQYYRTTAGGLFDAGEGNIVYIEGIGEDWIVGRDTTGHTYFAQYQYISELNWEEFLVNRG